MTIKEMERNANKQTPVDKLKFENSYQVQTYLTLCTIYKAFWRNGLTKTEAKQMKDEALANLVKYQKATDFDDKHLNDIKRIMASKTPCKYNGIQYAYVSACILRNEENKWHYYVEMKDKHTSSVTIVPIEKCEVITDD